MLASDSKIASSFLHSEDQKSEGVRFPNYPEGQNQLKISQIHSKTSYIQSEDSSKSGSIGLHSIWQLGANLRFGLRIGYWISLLTVSHTQIFSLILLNITVSVVIHTQVSLILDSNLITEVVGKQVFVGQIASSARMAPIMSDDLMKREFLRSLQTFIALLEVAQNNVWNEITEANSQLYQQYLIRKPITTWELLDGNIVQHPRTLIDAVEKLIDEGNNLLLAKNESFPLEAVYYLVRNGLGETYQALNKAQEVFIQSQSSQIAESIQLYYIYLIIAFLALTAFTGFALVFALKAREIAIGISKIALSNPINIYFEQKRKVAQRLQERYEAELDLSIERPFRGVRRLRPLYHPAFQTTVVILIFWVLCAGFYSMIYFSMLADLSGQMEVIPIMTNYDANRLVSAIESEIWMNEVMMQQIGFNRSLIIPAFDDIPSPVWKLKQAQSQLSTASAELLTYVLTGFEITPSHFSFLYELTDFLSPYYHFGYRGGIKAFINDINCCVNAGFLYCQDLLPKLISTGIELASLYRNITIYYKDDCIATVFKTEILIISLMSSFSALLFFLLIAFLIFINQRIFRIGKALLKLCYMIQGEKETIERRKSSLQLQHSTNTPADHTLQIPIKS